MKNIIVIGLGLIVSCFLMLCFAPQYYAWVNSANGWSAFTKSMLSIEVPQDEDQRLGASAFTKRAQESIKAKSSSLEFWTPTQKPDGLEKEVKLQTPKSSEKVVEDFESAKSIAGYAFVAACIGAGMLAGFFLFWAPVIIVLVGASLLAVYLAINFLLYVVLPLISLAALLLLINHLNGGALVRWFIAKHSSFKMFFEEFFGRTKAFLKF